MTQAQHSVGSLEVGDRAAVVNDLPAAGLKAGELVWIKRVDDEITVARADGSPVATRLHAAQLRVPTEEDLKSAAGIRKRIDFQLPPWFRKYVVPGAALISLIIGINRFQDQQRRSAERVNKKPPTNQVQTAPLPRDRIIDSPAHSPSE